MTKTLQARHHGVSLRSVPTAARSIMPIPASADLRLRFRPPGRRAISQCRLHIDFKDVGGRPDGCTIDSDGHLWVAVIEGGDCPISIRQAARSAGSRCRSRVDQHHAFGGEDLRTLTSPA